MRKLSRFLAAAALPILAGAVRADEPAIRFAPAEAQVSRVNQRLADDVAKALRGSGRLSNYAIDVATEGGVATLSGVVSDSAQKAAALNVARRTPGVVSVADGLATKNAEAVLPVLFQDNAPPPADLAPVPTRVPGTSVLPQVPTPGAMLPGNAPGNALPYHPHAGPGQLPAGAMPGPGGPFGPGGPGGPLPANSFPGGLAPYSDTPVVPPYAWPAYTPYNNYASMAYQTQYPSGAWPFIGPPHPYPMIPSGWRSVNLRWKKGYWFLRFNAF